MEKEKLLKGYLLITIIICSLVGCKMPWNSTGANNNSLDDLVYGIVNKANENQIDYFKQFLVESEKSWGADLIDMIKRSEMLSNYKEHFERTSENSATLNYHYPEKNCYFQIYLIQIKNVWEINQIRFCK